MHTRFNHTLTDPVSRCTARDEGAARLDHGVPATMLPTPVLFGETARHEPTAMLTTTSTETFAVPLGHAAFDASEHTAPLDGVFARAGFPSPAEDFLDDELDLHRLLVWNPAATYLYRARGCSMMLAGICDGDVLVVDRSVQPREGDVVVVSWDGQQPVCKVLHIAADHIELHSRNPHCKNIVLAPDTGVEIFAVVSVALTLRRGAALG